MWADEQDANERRQAVLAELAPWAWPKARQMGQTLRWSQNADALVRALIMKAKAEVEGAYTFDPSQMWLAGRGPEGNRAKPIHMPACERLEDDVGDDEAIWNLFRANGMWPSRQEPALLPKEKEELIRLRERERIMAVREDHWAELVRLRERSNRMDVEVEDLYEQTKALKTRAMLAEATRDAWMGDNQRMRLEAQEHGMIADDLTARLERWQRGAVAAMSLASGMVAAVAAHLAGVL